jgi:HepT-like protein
MIERYALVSGRIRQELRDMERVISRAEQAIAAARRQPADLDFCVDSAALNLHDFYAGMERLLHYIAAQIDRSVPEGSEWHRELLLQMGVQVQSVRPPALAAESVRALDEFLRFRHVVRNVYAFSLDPAQIERLVSRARPAFERAQTDLLAFADFLDRLATSDEKD